MTALNVVIVERPNFVGGNLRNSFTGVAKTHVVRSFAAADALIETKKIDAAVIRFCRDDDTEAFCRKLARLGIPYIYG